VVPELDLTKAEVGKVGEVYALRMPWSAGDVRMNLASMREIESYSPYRILDVCVKSGENACVVVQVATENKSIVFNECDVIRIKRRKY
jgi:hypothetical protein